MKLKQTSDSFAIGGLSNNEQSSFTIKASGHAFRVLSDGLYTNKIQAVIRELMCNAKDSHTDAGVKDQFIVHLPTHTEPFFAVEDFGLGLSHEQVMTLYKTYFESTKQNSNDVIGALGLGSKSPFSYTSAFTVTATKDGVRGLYKAYIDDSYTPSVVQLSSEETNERNGVRVEFAVNPRDFSSFRTEFQRVIFGFNPEDRPAGVSGFEQLYNNIDSPDIQVGPLRIFCGYSSSLFGYDFSHPIYARQGSVVYPLPSNGSSLIDKNVYTKIHTMMATASTVIIDFPIGSLDVAASREQLSYDEATVEVINKQLNLSYKLLKDYFQKEIDGCRNFLEVIRYFHKSTRKFRLDSTEYTYKDRPSPLSYSLRYKGIRRADGSISQPVMNRGLSSSVEMDGSVFKFTQSRRNSYRLMFTQTKHLSLSEEMIFVINDSGYSRNKLRSVLEFNYPAEDLEKIRVMEPSSYVFWNSFVNAMGLTEEDFTLTSSMKSAPRQKARPKNPVESRKICYIYQPTPSHYTNRHSGPTISLCEFEDYQSVDIIWVFDNVNTTSFMVGEKIKEESPAGFLTTVYSRVLKKGKQVPSSVLMSKAAYSKLKEYISSRKKKYEVIEISKINDEVVVADYKKHDREDITGLDPFSAAGIVGIRNCFGMGGVDDSFRELHQDREPLPGAVIQRLDQIQHDIETFTQFGFNVGSSIQRDILEFLPSIKRKEVDIHKLYDALFEDYPELELPRKILDRGYSANGHSLTSVVYSPSVNNMIVAAINNRINSKVKKVA